MPGAFAATGGVQLVNRNLAKALAQAPAWAADFFCLQDDQPDVRYTGARAFHGFQGRKMRLAAAVSGALMRNSYDLAMAAHVNLAPLATLFRTMGGRTVVLTYGIEAWRRLTGIRRREVAAASRVLAISRFTRQKLCAANRIPEEKVTVLPLCLDYYWTPELADVTAGHPPDSPLLLTVARSLKSERYKGQDAVLRALPAIARAHPAVRYIIAGGGDDLERLRQLSVDCGVADRVDIIGRAPDAVLRDLYRRCSVFVMPSRGEGFGLVYLEAMAYGKPCVASNCDAGQEIVRHGENGFTVDPANPAEIAEVVLRLLNNQDLRAAMGDAGRRILHREYTYPRFAATLLGTLEQVLKTADASRQHA
jgi:glycosyltransferase involved in cell wall biosynthesis